MKTGYCHIYNHKLPLDSITDRLHIGNRWLGHLGLAMYDNTARVHDPVMPHMLTCDSRAVDYPGHSPFSHCAGNPANIVDLYGDSLNVPIEHRAIFSECLKDVFGKESSNFEYTNSGMLNIKSNFGKLSKNQKNVLEGLMQIIGSDENAKLIYGKEYVYMKNDGSTEIIKSATGSGALTAFPIEKNSRTGIIILVDPSITSIRVNETTNNFPGQVNTIAHPWYNEKIIPVNTTDMTFHEFGHFIYRGLPQDKVLNYNNYVRNILNLPKRHNDEFHNPYLR